MHADNLHVKMLARTCQKLPNKIHIPSYYWEPVPQALTTAVLAVYASNKACSSQIVLLPALNPYCQRQGPHPWLPPSLMEVDVFLA